MLILFLSIYIYIYNYINEKLIITKVIIILKIKINSILKTHLLLIVRCMFDQLNKITKLNANDSFNRIIVKCNPV